MVAGVSTALTITVSVVVSLIGSGALAALVQARLADKAADRAFERNLKGVKAAQLIERRNAQEATIDVMVGHAVSLLTKAQREPPIRLLGDVLPYLHASISDEDTGRLTDTAEGSDVVIAYNRCKDAFKGTQVSYHEWETDVLALDEGLGRLNIAARQWREKRAT
jgi:hypothetical protein